MVFVPFTFLSYLSYRWQLHKMVQGIKNSIQRRHQYALFHKQILLKLNQWVMVKNRAKSKYIFSKLLNAKGIANADKNNIWS